MPTEAELKRNSDFIRKFETEVGEIKAQVIAIQQSAHEPTQQQIKMLEDSLQRLDAKFGFRVGIRWLQGDNRVNYNQTMQALMAAFEQVAKRESPTSAERKCDQFLKSDEIVDFVRGLGNLRHRSIEDINNLFQSLLAGKEGFSGRCVGVGNSANFQLTIDGETFFLKIHKKLGRCSLEGLYDLQQGQETSALFPREYGKRAFLASDIELSEFDAVTVVEPVRSDVFTLGSTLSVEDRVQRAVAIFQQMTAMFQQLYAKDMTMEDGKASNFGVDSAGNVKWIDTKSVAKLDDIEANNMMPNNTRGFSPVDDELFVDRQKLTGEALRERQMRLMTYFIGTNLAIFLLGETEDSIGAKTDLSKQGAINEFVQQNLATISEDDPRFDLARLSMELLEGDKTLAYAQEQLSTLAGPLMQASSLSESASSSSSVNSSTQRQSQLVIQEDYRSGLANMLEQLNSITLGSTPAVATRQITRDTAGDNDEEEVEQSPGFFRRHATAIVASTGTGLVGGLIAGVIIGVIFAIPTGGASFVAIPILGLSGAIGGAVAGSLGSLLRDRYIKYFSQEISSPTTSLDSDSGSLSGSSYSLITRSTSNASGQLPAQNLSANSSMPAPKTDSASTATGKTTEKTNSHDLSSPSSTIQP